MKQIILLLVTCLICACTKDKLDTYQADRYIYFSSSWMEDSTIVSFFYYPGKDVISIPLYLSFAGNEITENISYRLVVDETLTTAQAENYDVEENFLWKAGQFRDTAYITLRKSDVLNDREVRLVLRLEGNESFQVGPADHLEYRIIFSSVISQPEWWNTNIVNNYLGAYSDAKFEEFIKATGVGDLMGITDDTTLRYYALKFKYYLQRVKDETGEPIMDGKVEMSVPIIG